MNNAPTINGGKVLLRKPKPQDIEDRMLIGKPVEYVKMCGGDTRNIPEFTREHAIGWYEGMMHHPCEWVIEFEGKCIGITRLTTNKEDNRATYDIGIFDISKLNAGIGTIVTKLVLNYAFDVLGLHRVSLRVLEYNLRAIKCYKKCGFIQEGIEREDAFIEGKYYSDILMSILKSEHDAQNL